MKNQNPIRIQWYSQYLNQLTDDGLLLEIDFMHTRTDMLSAQTGMLNDIADAGFPNPSDRMVFDRHIGMMRTEFETHKNWISVLEKEVEIRNLHHPDFAKEEYWYPKYLQELSTPSLKKEAQLNHWEWKGLKRREKAMPQLVLTEKDQEDFKEECHVNQKQFLLLQEEFKRRNITWERPKEMEETK